VAFIEGSASSRLINSLTGTVSTTPATTNSLADLAWWNLYQDPTLAGLIRTALTNNCDLRIAVTRAEQARQLAAQAHTQFLPGVGYQGGIS
jgi:multidrug efflux system outer membrane protein